MIPRCRACGQVVGPEPWLSEDWPPYRWLWRRVGGRPWTWIMRERPAAYLALAGPLLVVLAARAGARWWAVLAGFALGALTGHVWW